MTLTLDDGAKLVGFARAVIEDYFKGETPKPPPELSGILAEDRGVFVTLERHPSGDLRGCIGFPEPVMPLGDAIRDGALSAALRDPRFPQVEESELANLTVEVSVLTPPEEIKFKSFEELPSLVKVGRDGLIVEKSGFRGLLLPQVPVEWKWSEEEFLAHTCSKAGLNPEAWKVPGTKIFSFQAQVFSETVPRGKVVEKDLSPENP